MKDSILLTQSKAFARRVVRLYKYLRDRKESVIVKQMLRSGTSVGANIAESRYAQSKPDLRRSYRLRSRKRQRLNIGSNSFATVNSSSRHLPSTRSAPTAPNSSSFSPPASRQRKRMSDLELVVSQIAPC